MALSNRIILSFVVLLALVGVGVYVSGKLVLDRVETALLSLNGETATATTGAVLAQNQNTLTASGREIARDREATAHLVAQEYVALEDLMMSSFNRLAASGTLSDMVYYDLDGQPRVAYSTSEDETLGGVTPPIIEKVRSSGRRAFEVSQLDQSRFGAIYAQPLLKGRETVGYLLLAVDLASALPAISETTGGNVVLATTGPAGFGDPATQVSAMQWRAPTPPEEAQDGAVQDEGAIPEAQEVLSTILTALDDKAAPFATFSIGEQFYVVAQHRLGEIGEGVSRNVYLISDFTAQQAGKMAAIRSTAAGLGLFVVIFLVAMLTWMRFQLRPLKLIATQLRALSQGKDVTPSTPKRAASEIAALNDAMSAFIDQARALKLEQEKAAQQAEEIAAQSDRIREQAAREAEAREVETRRLEEEQRDRETQRLAEQAAASEIARVVEACARGDFTQMLRTDDKKGVFLDICEQVNGIGEAANTGLQAVLEALNCLENRDLTHSMPHDFPGIFGEIATSMNATRDSLASTMTAIATSAEQVDNTARELANATGDLATRSERTAASLEQTATALDEMKATVQSVAVGTEDTKSSVETISNRAESGHSLVQQTSEAMEMIKNSSQSIEKILGIIEDIAFQTNLLALNAGVEAARAGESGRGFSVVASEVRALAQRSAESAKEIAGLISSSSQNVEAGVQLVDASGVALTEIVSEVALAVAKIDQIVVATTESAKGIKDISATTGKLDQSTQANAASLEEINAAVHSQKGQAQALAASVKQFKVLDNARGNNTRGATSAIAAE